jgi:hypothetical protein
MTKQMRCDSANLVRRWLNGRDTGVDGAVTVPPAQGLHRAVPAAANFVPVQPDAAKALPADIRLELRRGGSHGHRQLAEQRGPGLREWLR